MTGRIWVLVLLITTAVGSVGAAERLRVGGSGTDLGTFRQLADAFMRRQHEVEIEVLPSLGSSGGLAALSEGAIDLALVSRPLAADELALDIRVVPYARTPLVFAVSARNPVAGISHQQLVAILGGRQRHWPDATPLHLVLRPKHESDNQYLLAQMPAIGYSLDASLVSHGQQVAMTDQDAADFISQHPGAIGTSTLALILGEGRPLKALALDGVTPSPESLARGSYRLYKDLFMVLPTTPSATVQAFVAFVLSPQGRDILRRTGHLPHDAAFDALP